MRGIVYEESVLRVVWEMSFLIWENNLLVVHSGCAATVGGFLICGFVAVRVARTERRFKRGGGGISAFYGNIWGINGGFMPYQIIQGGINACFSFPGGLFLLMD